MITFESRHFVASLAIGACCACAGIQKIPPDQEAAYFRCNGVDNVLAEQNLSGNGYTVEREGTAKMQTGWKQLPSGFLKRGQKKDGFGLVMQVYEARISATEQTGGMSWSAEYRPVNANPTSITIASEENFAPIAVDQVSEPQMKQVLNNMRKAVCGGDSYFP